MKFFYISIISILFLSGIIYFNQEEKASSSFSTYLSSLYSHKSFPLCEETLPKDSCEKYFEGLTTKEITLQEEFFKQNGRSPIFIKKGNFTETLDQLFSPNLHGTTNLRKIAGVFNFYTFIAGTLKVKGKFVLEESPIEILEFCSGDPTAPCPPPFPHIYKLYFQLSETAEEDFQTGTKIEVGCWDKKTSELFMDYELVDLKAKTFQFFTKKASQDLNALIETSLENDGEDLKILLRIAPNARYAIEDLVCPNYYFLNPQKI